VHIDILEAELLNALFYVRLAAAGTHEHQPKIVVVTHAASSLEHRVEFVIETEIARIQQRKFSVISMTLGEFAFRLWDRPEHGRVGPIMNDLDSLRGNAVLTNHQFLCTITENNGLPRPPIEELVDLVPNLLDKRSLPNLAY